MKKLLAASIPFFITHLLCCGTLLFFLISSGMLLVIRQEGTNKTFLIPILLISGVFVWLYRYYNKCCSEKGGKTFIDHFIIIILYLSFSLMLGLALMIYIFIPWWIPNYKGGNLLP